MEKQNLIYTNVCLYCGVVYKSNRSTSKYCGKLHNSLYAKYGSMIKPKVMEDGTVRNYDYFLDKIYGFEKRKNEDNWSLGYAMIAIKYEIGYEGPFPLGEELLVIGRYVIKRIAKKLISSNDLFYVKPFILLTLKERLSAVIVAAADDKG